MLGALSLALEARRWRRAGRTLRMWWRDDDATAPTLALRRLLLLSQCAPAPLALAVVPQTLDPGLAKLVNTIPTVSVLQHGVDHISRRAPDQVPAQFADGQPTAHIASEIEAADEQLLAFERRLPIYVPPWNAIEASLPAALAGLGLSLSAFGGKAGERRIDTHLDLLRWGEGRPRFRGCGRLLRKLARLMRERRLAGEWGQPVGLLTHHLVHDDAAWRFLESLFARLERTGAVRWFDVGAEHFQSPSPLVGSLNHPSSM